MPKNNFTMAKISTRDLVSLRYSHLVVPNDYMVLTIWLWVALSRWVGTFLWVDI